MLRLERRGPVGRIFQEKRASLGRRALSVRVCVGFLFFPAIDTPATCSPPSLRTRAHRRQVELPPEHSFGGGSPPSKANRRSSNPQSGSFSRKARTTFVRRQVGRDTMEAISLRPGGTATAGTFASFAMGSRPQVSERCLLISTRSDT